MAPDAGYGHKAYRQVQFESMTPGELVLAVYDVAIRACEERNMRRAGEAIVELMNGLDFTYQEIAGNLLVLYDYIYRRVREGAFDEAKRDLLDLREAWAKAVRATAPAEQAGDEAQVTRIAG